MKISEGEVFILVLEEKQHVQKKIIMLIFVIQVFCIYQKIISKPNQKSKYKNSVED